MSDYSLFLARRIALQSEGEKRSPAIKVAIAAVALSITVMLMAIAIVMGFKREIRDKVTGFNSHITLFAVPQSDYDSNLITYTPTLKKLLDQQPFITSHALEASVPAIIKTPDNFKGVYLKSLAGAQLLDFLNKNMTEGKVPDYSKEGTQQQIVLSQSVANQLGLKLGDKIDTYFISDAVRVRRLEITGIFNSHFDSYDNIFIYGNLNLIQDLAQIDDKQGTAISIAINDFNNLDQYTKQLQQELNKGVAEGLLYTVYRTENAHTMGAGYFQWLGLLDMNVIVILTLMIFVACITLISGMLIIILDKKRFIGLIRSLGAPISRVRRIFVYLALRVALIGIVIGNLITLPLLWIQDRYHIIPLNADSYYIDFVPVEISWQAILILNLATVVIIYLSLILPSWFAAKISPAETMRYE